MGDTGTMSLAQALAENRRRLREAMAKWQLRQVTVSFDSAVGELEEEELASWEHTTGHRDTPLPPFPVLCRVMHGGFCEHEGSFGSSCRSVAMMLLDREFPRWAHEGGGYGSVVFRLDAPTLVDMNLRTSINVAREVEF